MLRRFLCLLAFAFCVHVYAQNYGPPFPPGSFYHNGPIIGQNGFAVVGCPMGYYIKGDGTGCGPGGAIPVGLCKGISSGGDCVTDDPTVTQIITQSNTTQFGVQDNNDNELLFTASNGSPEVFHQLTKFGDTLPADNWIQIDENYGGVDMTLSPPVGSLNQHVYNVDNSGFNFLLPFAELRTDTGGDIELNAGGGESGVTPAASSIQLLGNISLAGGGGGPGGTCTALGKLCTTTTLEWNQGGSNLYGGLNLFNLDATTGSFTVTLAAASGPDTGIPTTLWFFREDSTTNVVTLAAGSGDTINGASSIAVATATQALQIISDGHHAWYVIGSASGYVANSGITEGCNANGCWEKYPSGHIHQWGHIANETSNCNLITFPIAFTSTTNLTPTITDDFATGSSIEHSAVIVLSHSCAAITTTTVNDWVSSTGGNGAWWTADGF